MPKQKSLSLKGAKAKKPQESSSSSYLREQISFINTQRVRFNRSKNIACFSVDKSQVVRNIKWIESPLGIMSFSLNYVRLTLSLHQLYNVLSSSASAESDIEKNRKKRNELIFSVINDVLWGTVNMIEYFWLSFKNSKTHGILGLKLEIMAMLIDLLIMTINHQQSYQDHLKELSEATPEEKKALEIEWSYKQANYIRSIIQISVMMSALSSLAFVNLATPISPLMFSASLTSNILRVHWKWEKTYMLIEQMKKNGKPSKEIWLEEQKFKSERISDVNELILYYAVLPSILFMTFTAPLVAVGLFTAAVVSLEVLLSKYQSSQQSIISQLENSDDEDLADQDTQFAFLSTVVK